MVSLAEQVEMVKQVVEIVKWQALAPALIQCPLLFVGNIEKWVEAAKQGGHAQFGLRPSVMGSRIDERRAAAAVTDRIAAPQVAVDQGSRLPRHQVWQAGAKPLYLGGL